METLENFLEEINNSSRTELENTIMELKREVNELYSLVDTLEYNLKMAKQILNDNDNYYFNLEGNYLEYSKEQGIIRNCIAGDYIFQAINDIEAVQGRYQKEGKS